MVSPCAENYVNIAVQQSGGVARLVSFVAGWTLRRSHRCTVLGSRWFSCGRCNKQFFTQDIRPQYVGVPDGVGTHGQRCGYRHIPQGQHLSSGERCKGICSICIEHV